MSKVFYSNQVTLPNLSSSRKCEAIL